MPTKPIPDVPDVPDAAPPKMHTKIAITLTIRIFRVCPTKHIYTSIIYNVLVCVGVCVC